MYMDIYAIQNVPPSNINRDETGNPKTALYGGVLRSRVSSQAWKRAMRHTFCVRMGKDHIGKRTMNAVQLIVDSMVEQRPKCAAEKASKYASAVLKAIGIKTKPSKRAGAASGKPVTDYLVFLANTEIKRLAALALEWMDQGKKPTQKLDTDMQKEMADIFHNEQAVDIALFGRMLADAPDLNTDASAQVAHAISVDAIRPEYDFFTAKDDCSENDNAGAAMMDSVGFNSSTLYRYANVNLTALREQLGNIEVTSKAASVFVEAFIRSMPTGKQNSYGNRTLPETCIVAFRDNQPINAVEAFEKPVKASEDKSITQIACLQLIDELHRIEKAYDEKPKHTWVTSTIVSPEDLEPTENLVSLTTLINQVDAETKNELKQHEQSR
ncbi:type I-E CRISPR-associated protein Cas7/Cse4/CasC [Bifidobacterium polysaccharolyticum]|uniref:type I-E CRISPR-associated protein Cas7/Cse4/CasC n=1 Tax=Bifidobacterium polysaccharolyticum TaxID=2750967 RepID=UPI0018DD54D0|nr:type I-E CRISPR-associated protein Cas7/Cse4/CasC [Bifidobacterium polysaccharolyticum]MBI0064144.1 type I-E CRISPR-associated protein Cas7/Cse4/CasC [Bifidobacterium polysaccharolyticum]